MKKIILFVVTAIASLTLSITSFCDLFPRAYSPQWKETIKGWQLIDTSNNMLILNDMWYCGDNMYFFKQGYMIHDAWVTAYDKYQYYCGSDGAVLKNTTTPDGYKVDSMGRYVDSTNTEIQDPNYVETELLWSTGL